MVSLSSALLNLFFLLTLLATVTSILYRLNLLLLVSLILSLYALTLLARLYKNYTSALRIGLPILFIPFDPFGVPWLFIYSYFGPLLAPFRCCRFLTFTWHWEDGDRWHKELGESFVLVGVGRNYVHTSDEVAIEWVLGRRKEFPKPRAYEGLDLFGKNVNTVNGQEWTRHRKLTAPCFNERVSSFVWSEAVRQSAAMLTTWITSPRHQVTTMVDDTRIIALHVLYAAGFGTSHDFAGGKRVAAPGHELSHRDALLTVLENILSAIFLSAAGGIVERWKGLLGKRLRNVLLAIKEFKMYTDEAIAAERAILASGYGEAKHNLMSTLIRTSDQAKADGIHSAVRLSDGEIKGNIFIFNLAGHDTTANTLGYAFALLACHAEVQDWVVEEIDSVFGEGETSYEVAFPRLKRVLAVMYETLRLYGPVSTIPRAALPNTPLLLRNPAASSTREILIPQNTDLALKILAMHTSPTHFTNPTSWDPKRWIASSPASLAPLKLLEEKLLEEKLLEEKLLEEKLLEQKAFLPWSTGPRVCPGMKMSQVEFVGVLATVLRSVRVAPAMKGETTEEAKRRLLGTVRDSNADTPALKISHPEKICLAVKKR
ncbi:cytochrome P450 [Lentithecium fluviatile CBS 122367]|uniref:Cytochrome P450 n=1 Tax=Lentithecium fluviatile CBS 122367 TaxID=1168545 RepID=A0A6G1IF10_9PLEO|nr:cytochrome P450 [Lentithecium fluviatile CBS 122367]